jgi:hypothetical protein
MVLVDARIEFGALDRSLLLYCALFGAFGVASPFLPALLHERRLGPSQIGAVLAAGTAIRLIIGPVISRACQAPLCAAALPIAFAIRRISISASGPNQRAAP